MIVAVARADPIAVPRSASAARYSLGAALQIVV